MEEGASVVEEIVLICSNVLEDEELVASSVVATDVEVAVVEGANVVVLVAAGAGVAEGAEMRSSPVAAVVDVEARVTSS